MNEDFIVINNKNNSPSNDKLSTLKSKINPSYVIIFSIIAIVIITLIAISINLLSRDKRLKIDNFDTYLSQYADSKLKQNTYESLYIAAFKNSNNNNLPTSGALIREKSVDIEKNEYDDFTISYIVDIDSIKHSYQISYVWFNKNSDSSADSIDVQCIHDPSLIIYSDFNCSDGYTLDGDPNEDPDLTIDINLPYENYLNNKDHTYFRALDNGDFEIMIHIDDCKDTYNEDILKTVKEYISSFKIDPERFSYTVKDLCDGEPAIEEQDPSTIPEEVFNDELYYEEADY